MSEENTGGKTQAQLAREALQAATAKANAPEEEKAQEGLSARQKAMQGLQKGGVVSRREAAGQKGESQHSAAMKNLHIDEPKEKVIPNWKQTASQRKAYEEKKAMRQGGESQMSAAMKAFGGQLGDSAHGTSSASSTPRTFVPTAKNVAVGGSVAKKFQAANTPSSAEPPRPVNAAPPVHRPSMTTSGAGAAEAEEGVTHDLELLTAGIKRLGVAEADGSVVATFGSIVDDEELEQQLESLVGTLKAGRRRGVLEWQGQLLLKGKDDAAPIKLLAAKDGAASAPPAEEAPASAPDAVEVS